jgi:hypothetical protein
MNATTSRYGVLTDPPIVALVTSPLVVALLAAHELSLGPLVVQVLGVLAALPLLVAVAVSLALRGARARVVDWLAGLPFPVENMNAVLNGLGDGLEITFTDACPSSLELNAELDKVSPDAFVIRAPDVVEAPGPAKGAAAGSAGGSAPSPGEPFAPADVQDKGPHYRASGRANEPCLIEVRIGVVDSKRNPAGTNHQRFERVRALVSSVLVPLHRRFKVATVRIK